MESARRCRRDQERLQAELREARSGNGAIQVLAIGCDAEAELARVVCAGGGPWSKAPIQGYESSSASEASRPTPREGEDEAIGKIGEGSADDAAGVAATSAVVTAPEDDAAASEIGGAAFEDEHGKLYLQLIEDFYRERRPDELAGLAATLSAHRGRERELYSAILAEAPEPAAGDALALATPAAAPLVQPRRRRGSSRERCAAARWEPNSASCTLCSSLFTVINRRHHCRQCGQNVCSACSPFRVALAGPVIRPAGPAAALPLCRLRLPRASSAACLRTSTENFGRAGAGRASLRGGSLARAVAAPAPPVALALAALAPGSAELGAHRVCLLCHDGAAASPLLCAAASFATCAAVAVAAPLAVLLAARPGPRPASGGA